MAGSLNSSSFDETIRTVKRGLLSRRTTTAVTSNDIETIFASTIAGNNITLASAGDVNILDSNIVSELATDILAGGSIVISSVPTASSYYNSFKVKKSGFSIGGSGLFLGVSKSSQITTLDTVSNAGSVIGAARGNVSLSAGVLGLRTAASGTSGALLIKGSEVSAPGLIRLSGDNVAIENNFDSANSTSIFRQSSFGLSINFYENVSGAVNSVSGLGARINASGQGTAGTAISAASETLRSVAAVTTALTNTAGVTASIGFSSSRRSSAAQEIGVVASNIAGGSVDIRGTDVRVAGSTITAINDLTIVAQRDAIFQSAQNRLATQDSSSSSSFGVGATLGVGIVGGVSASAFVNFGTSYSNGSSLSATQFNSQIVSGGLLSLTSGQDMSLRGAVVQGRDVNASIGRNLLIESLQDSASSNSNSYVFNLGLTYGGGAGFGFNGGINYGYGTSIGRRVSEQSSLVARGGALNANVVGSTNLIGGVIAALDSGRADTGRLTLRTGSLITSNIADSASSLNYGFGLSINFNDVFNQGISGANYPVFDGYYGSTAFAQNTRATIGVGSLIVGNGVLPAALNRDVTQSQVVTKDRATGFSLYVDVVAATEIYNLVGGLVNGRTGNSIILQGVNALRARPLGLIQDTINEVRSFGSTLGDPATRNDSQIEKLFNQLGATFLPEDVAVAQAARQVTDDFRAAALARGVDPVQLEVELRSPEFQEKVAVRVARIQVADYRRNERPVLTGRVAEVAALINSPPAQSGAATTTNNSLGEEIVVTACPRSGCDPRTSLAHDAAAGIGSYYNDGSSFRRTVIDAGIGVVSGGPAGYVFGEVAGALQSQILPARAQELLGNLSTAVNVGVDSFFQGRSFGTVGTENANRDNTFQSHNATTGAGLIIQAIPGTRSVFRGRGRGSSSSSRRPERARTCSFHGDTFVRTLMGLTPIKDIKAGTDQVWARDAETGEMGYRLVEAQYSNPYDVTVKVSIRDAETGNAQTLVSNKIHPFFVQLPEVIAAPPSSEGHSYSGDIKRGAWVDASNLKAGYRLLNDDGSWAEVTGLAVENTPLTAYNLKVSGFHTYFVTANANAEPVWVHNDCRPPHLAQIGDTIDVSTFSERIRINGQTFLRDPNTGYLIQRDRAGDRAHGGSAYKEFGRQTGSANPPRLWTLSRDGVVLRP